MNYFSFPQLERDMFEYCTVADISHGQCGGIESKSVRLLIKLEGGGVEANSGLPPSTIATRTLGQEPRGMIALA